MDSNIQKQEFKVQKDMIKSFTFNNTSDSILSRICLVSLIWLLLILGGFSSRAWGRTSSVNTAALWKSSTYSTGDSVVWSAPNVTFKLHNGGNIELYLSDHILIQKNRHYTLEWRVAEGYTINVTQVSVRARSTEEAYITVGGGDKSDNIFASYTTVNSQALSLGNNGTVDIYPESEDRDDAIIHMDEINVTYTIVGVAQEVTFDSWNDYDHSKTATTNGPFTKYPADGTTFTMGGDFKRYTEKNNESNTHFFLTNTTTGLLGKSYTGTLSWTQPTGYTIAVEGISINTFSKGKLYIWPNNDTGKEIRIIDNYNNAAGQTKTYVYNSTYTFTNSSTGYLFPGGNKMGASDQFKFKATSNEVKINTLTVKYSLTANTYNITLNNESPTTSGSTSVTVTYDANNQLSITNPTKYGYTFDGWYSGETDGNGSGTEIIDVDGNLQADKTVGGTVYTGAEGVWKKTTATTLYAKWILNSDKTITLSNQSATIAGTASITVRYNTNGYSKNPIDVPAKTGYTFDGYYSAISGGVQIIDAGGNVVASAEGYTDSSKNWINGDEETTLYAHWTGVSYSVRFNGNGNTGGGMDDQAFTYGTAQNLTANAFSKTCMVTYDANEGSCGTTSSEAVYDFEGWATSAGGDVEYTDEKEVKNLTSTSGATVDLYAKWATVADTIVLPTPTKDGYVFLGWYNSSNVLVGDAGGPYTPTGSETLEARWVQALTSTVNKSTLLDNFDGDAKSVSWSTEHVTFTLAGDGLKKETWLGTTHFYLYATNSKAWQYDLTWTIDSKDAEGNSAYTISVKKVTFDIERASGLGTYMTIEGRKSGNIYDNGNIPSGGISSGTLSKGENETVTTLIETSDIFYSNIVLNNVTVIYTLEPIINVASEQSVPVTICDENKQLLDLSTCASLADQSGHIALNYSLIGDNADNAHKTLDNKFYADVVDTYRVRASVDAAADCHSGKTVEFTINVIPATLELTAPTASDITYPATLASSTLTGGAAMIGSCEVEGTWAWQNSSTRPSVGDGQSFPVVFTPSENASYYTNFVTNATVNVLAYIFTGEGDDDDQANIWTKDDNWNVDNTPTIENVVIIRHNVIIEDEVSAYSVEIEDGYTLTIAPTGGLTVGAGGISGATKDKLILRADKGAAKSARKGQTGYLRISPEYTGAMPEAALELYSVAYHDMSRSGDDVAVWQAVGAPISDAGVSAKSVYTKSWIYSWDEEADDWVNNRKTLTFKPFTGYITSQYKYPEGITLTYNGHIVSGRTSQVIDLAYSGEGKGHNLLANSYAAPIDISRFNVGDFYHATPTIYIQNAGTCAESSSQMDGISAEKAAAPGQYLAIPINTAASLASTYNYPVLIPAMQGFWVDATADDGTITLDYNRLVWNADYSTHPNVPLRAPQYKAQEVTENESEEMPQVGSLQISLEANGWYDNLFMLESERYNTAYEPGSDALKKESGTLNIFTLENDDKLAIDATNSILGTRVGVRTGEETAYTMTFSHVNSQEELALYDSETEQTIDINEGTQYTFFAESNAMIMERFEIVARADAPAITTGVDKVENGAKVHKFIKGNQLFILKNGVLYNATGAVVR